MLTIVGARLVRFVQEILDGEVVWLVLDEPPCLRASRMDIGAHPMAARACEHGGMSLVETRVYHMGDMARAWA